MAHPFEELPTAPLSEELLDTAFSRAARAGRAKSGVEAQQSMLQTATNVISDNLEHVVTAWPDLERLDPFYRGLADALVGVDRLRQHLNEVGWASRKATEIRQEYEPRLAGDPEVARKHRKQAFARLADVVEEIEDDLTALLDARETLRKLPDIRPDEPALVVAGYPNVGKSTFVNTVTRAHNETAAYPFTTTQVHVGHVEHGHIRYQLVDTPGLLDRPPEEHNDIESQATSALEHAADAVLVVLDPSGDCGYPLDTQRDLRDSLAARFDVPVLTVYNKVDRLDDTRTVLDADEGRDGEGDELLMSLADDENVKGVLQAAIEAVDYEPELPID
jgi:nucleolar GTP-binding protein